MQPTNRLSSNLAATIPQFNHLEDKVVYDKKNDRFILIHNEKQRAKYNSDNFVKGEQIRPEFHNFIKNNIQNIPPETLSHLYGQLKDRITRVTIPVEGMMGLKLVSQFFTTKGEEFLKEIIFLRDLEQTLVARMKHLPSQILQQAAVNSIESFQQLGSRECKIRWNYRGVDTQVLGEDTAWNEKKAPDMKDFTTEGGEAIKLEPGDYLFPLLVSGESSTFPLEQFYLPGSLIRDLKPGDTLKLQYMGNLYNFQIDDPDFQTYIHFEEELLYTKNYGYTTQPLSQANKDLSPLPYPHPSIQAEKRENARLLQEIKSLLSELKLTESRYLFDIVTNQLVPAQKKFDSSIIRAPQIIKAVATPSQDNAAHAVFDMATMNPFLHVFILDKKIVLYSPTEEFNLSGTIERSERVKEKLAIIDCSHLQGNQLSIQSMQDDRGVIRVKIGYQSSQ